VRIALKTISDNQTEVITVIELSVSADPETMLVLVVLIRQAKDLRITVEE